MPVYRSEAHCHVAEPTRQCASDRETSMRYKPCSHSQDGRQNHSSSLAQSLLKLWLSFVIYREDVHNIILLQSPNIFYLIKKTFGHGS